jgi:type III secretion protein C
MGIATTAGAAPNWPNVPYSYYAEQEDLPALLREFAAGFSLGIQIGPGVSGRVNGKFNASSPTDFLNRLGGVYGFNWFVHSGMLFISRVSDMVTRPVNAMGNSISALRDALERLGVLDPRFGWGELPDQGIALVSGPPAYVELVERTVSALPMGTGGQEVVVFRLKHASVNDRTIRYRDQQLVVPGLATVLRNLIIGDSGGANNETLASIAAPLREVPPAFPIAGGAAVMGEEAVAATNGARLARTQIKAGSGLRLREPTVQADTRLNAIIVQDIPDRIPIYRALIEQLDLPSTLIEIEAMIVDVNSDFISELGVAWGAVSGRTAVGYGDLSLAPSGGLPIGSSEIAPGTIGLSVGSTLAARIRALQTDGHARILSQPSILTADNMGAIIDLSDTFYIQTRGERVATVTPVTAGTSLRVTPRYISSREGVRVELTVDIEDGRIQTERQIDGLPTVRRSTISTLAVVGDDQTLLIGGYNSSQDSEQVDKVPVLGDIPILGTLFSNRAKTIQRRERLFLIRPRVAAINGKAVIDPLADVEPVLNATWDDKRPLMGGGILIRSGSGPTRVIRNATADRYKASPISVKAVDLP